MGTTRTGLVWMGACIALQGAACGCSAEGSVPFDDASVQADAGHCADDGDCADGTFCNGVERCTSGQCAAGTPPCSAASCNEAMQRCPTVCPDEDGDGHASAACGGDDCDDADSHRHPGNTEVCDPGHDEDCIATTFGFVDADGDGYGSGVCCNDTMCGEDCDDACPSCHPTQVETCDARDNDCDMAVDESLLAGTYYADCDGDLFGAGPAVATDGCNPPTGAPPSCAGAPAATWATNAMDCNDGAANAHPGAAELCDAADQNCSGGGYDGLACDSPGGSEACSVECQAPGTGRQPCTAGCDLSPVCNPGTTSWNWTGSESEWGHGCGGGANGTVWCAQSNTLCHLLHGNAQTNLPAGAYTATWSMAVAFYPTMTLSFEGVVHQGGTPIGNGTLTISAGDGLRTISVPFRADGSCRPIELVLRNLGGGPTACVHSVTITRNGP